MDVVPGSGLPARAVTAVIGVYAEWTGMSDERAFAFASAPVAVVESPRLASRGGSTWRTVAMISLATAAKIFLARLAQCRSTCAIRRTAKGIARICACRIEAPNSPAASWIPLNAINQRVTCDLCGVTPRARRESLKWVRPGLERVASATSLGHEKGAVAEATSPAGGLC